MDNKFFQILGSVGLIWSLAPGDVKATDEIEPNLPVVLYLGFSHPQTFQVIS